MPIRDSAWSAEDQDAMEAVTIRPARPEEYEAVGDLTVAAYLEDGLISPTSSYISILRDAADRAAEAELLVAELAGELVGAVSYCPPDSIYAEIAAPHEGEFRMLAVVATARGKGVGGALIQTCIDRARESGLTGLRLSSQRNMGAAHRIYERIGFQRTPDRDWSPVPGVDLITYALEF
ncbi:GNAT family N-acetyltransferase [Actinomadura scrupuli]|uniref:GNAT family N-acetyltransferase n=1 Tax=Actinomadura scrupuli TaxID=559629 RepID=UPI003D9689CA